MYPETDVDKHDDVNAQDDDISELSTPVHQNQTLLTVLLSTTTQVKVQPMVWGTRSVLENLSYALDETIANFIVNLLWLQNFGD